MKYWLVLVLVALSWVPGWAQDRMKIGYIDVRRVVSESAAGKRAGDRLQVQVKKAEADTLRERQELERMRNDLDKKGPLLKEEERRNLESDFQKRSVTLQRTMTDLQQELAVERTRDDAGYSQRARRGGYRVWQSRKVYPDSRSFADSFRRSRRRYHQQSDRDLQ